LSQQFPTCHIFSPEVNVISTFNFKNFRKKTAKKNPTDILSMEVKLDCLLQTQGLQYPPSSENMNTLFTGRHDEMDLQQPSDGGSEAAPPGEQIPPKESE
jgi:hypothetical protein